MIARLMALMPNSRLLNLLIFLATALIIGAALYMEHVMLLEPCGLCITQRVFVVAAGLVCLAAAIHNPGQSGRRNYGMLAAAMCVAGAYFAIRQIWLTYLPDSRTGFNGIRGTVQPVPVPGIPALSATGVTAGSRSTGSGSCRNQVRHWLRHAPARPGTGHWPQ